MNSQNKRFKFRQAKESDSDIMLEIMEEEPTAGSISLIYTRRPDPFQSFIKESKNSIIIVCEDTLKNRIIGFGGISFHQLFVNGEKQKVGYLFGLRMLKAYRNNHFILHHAYDELYNFIKNKKLQFIYTTILSKNTQAQKLLEKKRNFMPVYHPWGEFYIYALRSKAIPGDRLNFKLSRTNPDDDNQFKTFINCEGSKKHFFPAFWDQDSIPDIPGQIQFYALRNDEDEIVACGGIWNQQTYKQYILQAYHGFLKLSYPIASRFGLAGFPRLPRIGNVLNFFTLSFWAVKDHNPVFLNALIDSIASTASHYSFFLVGMHSSDPMTRILETKRHISYKSKIYLVDWNHSQNPVLKINNSLIPYLECGYL